MRMADVSWGNGQIHSIQPPHVRPGERLCSTVEAHVIRVHMRTADVSWRNGRIHSIRPPHVRPGERERGYVALNVQPGSPLSCMRFLTRSRGCTNTVAVILHSTERQSSHPRCLPLAAYPTSPLPTPEANRPQAAPSLTPSLTHSCTVREGGLLQASESYIAATIPYNLCTAVQLSSCLNCICM